jgi:hypothetical protein
VTDAIWATSTAVGLAMLAAVWRLGNQLGSLKSDLVDVTRRQADEEKKTAEHAHQLLTLIGQLLEVTRRLTDEERKTAEHDKWHWRRLSQGLDRGRRKGERMGRRASDPMVWELAEDLDERPRAVGGPLSPAGPPAPQVATASPAGVPGAPERPGTGFFSLP